MILSLNFKCILYFQKRILLKMNVNASMLSEDTEYLHYWHFTSAWDSDSDIRHSFIDTNWSRISMLHHSRLVSPLPLACWNYGFETRWGHGCLSLVKVVCCQVEVSETGWSLVQRSPTERGVCQCDREASIMRRPWPIRGCWATGEKNDSHLATQTIHHFC
jgi:hypothetical protein